MLSFILDSMTQSDVSDMRFSPTQDMIERHEQYVKTTIKGLTDMWRDNGELQANEEPPEKILTYLNRMLRLEFKPEWMHPLDVLAVFAAEIDVSELPDSHPDRIDHFDAMRTRSGFRQYEWRKEVAKWLDVGVQQIKWYEPENAGDDDTTYIYRFFDIEDNLLYVGMSYDPALRFRYHRDNAMWWHYQVRHTIEECTSRNQAFQKETKAIKTERPIFNRVASERDHTDAVRYIMARSSFEPDTLF